jgi:hypothetical protein
MSNEITEAGMVCEWLVNGELPYDDTRIKDGKVRYLGASAKWFWCFQQYQRNCGISERDVCKSPISFGREIRKCFPPMSDIKFTKCSVEGFPRRQFNAYDPPGLAECRKFFAENFPMPEGGWNEEIKDWEVLYIDKFSWFKGM